jgi:hypothetical protein
MLCVPTAVTSSSFIGFSHMSNGWKEKEVSYEFAITSLLRWYCIHGQNVRFLRLAVSTGIQQIG